MDKKELREYIQERVALLSDEEKKHQSQQVSDQLLFLIQKKDIRTIALYSALADEIDLTMVLERCLIQERVVLLPKIVDDAMKFYEIASIQDMRPGLYSIQEPLTDIPRTQEIDMIVVPGRAFDGEGNRLGRGKGWYDRWLPKPPDTTSLHSLVSTPLSGGTSVSLGTKNPLFVGVCFAEQVVNEVPVDEWDIRMDRILFSSDQFC